MLTTVTTFYVGAILYVPEGQLHIQTLAQHIFCVLKHVEHSRNLRIDVLQLFESGIDEYACIAACIG